MSSGKALWLSEGVGSQGSTVLYLVKPETYLANLYTYPWADSV